jgi:putative addiction module killer protein
LDRRPFRRYCKSPNIEQVSQRKLGHFGDCQPVGEGLSEMRIHACAGYRVYFIRTGSVVYVLLCGGSKSTQKRDVATAKKLARELKKDAK